MIAFILLFGTCRYQHVKEGAFKHLLLFISESVYCAADAAGAGADGTTTTGGTTTGVTLFTGVTTTGVFVTTGVITTGAGVLTVDGL
jgi:hypothetical protein